MTSLKSLLENERLQMEQISKQPSLTTEEKKAQIDRLASQRNGKTESSKDRSVGIPQFQK
jgi:hypothetical protein